MTNKLLFDVGANVGAYAEARWTSNEFEKIICVEANSKAFGQLLSRFEKNSSVLPLYYAVSNTDNQKLTFYETKSSVLSTANEDWIKKKGYRFEGQAIAEVTSEVQVPTLTLDKMIHFFGTPDLIKVDVEGFEETVFEGLSIKTPLVCFEWAREMATESMNIVKRLEMIGFTEFSIQYDDDYLFTPEIYKPIDEFNLRMLKTRNLDWGMLWLR